jgi:D-alanine-D-alanine ligase
MNKNIAIISGGYSSEYEVSIKSGKQIAGWLKSKDYDIYQIIIDKDEWYLLTDSTKKYNVNKEDFTVTINSERVSFHCALITIHGNPGENGVLQSYFELMNIPYTTCGVLASSLTSDKYKCNKFLKSFDINVSDSILILDKNNIPTERIISEIGFPCFVKPNTSGCSFGVSKVNKAEDVYSAIQMAFTESNTVIVERCLEGTEVTCGILKTSKKELILPVTEIVTDRDFFDNEAKFMDSKTQEITPARISDKVKRACDETTSKIYDLIGCKGVIRIDYIIQGDTPYLLEVNTTPGMSEKSVVPQQVTELGMPLGDFFEEIIEESMQ